MCLCDHSLPLALSRSLSLSTSLSLPHLVCILLDLITNLLKRGLHGWLACIFRKLTLAYLTNRQLLLKPTDFKLSVNKLGDPLLATGRRSSCSWWWLFLSVTAILPVTFDLTPLGGQCQKESGMMCHHQSRLKYSIARWISSVLWWINPEALPFPGENSLLAASVLHATEAGHLLLHHYLWFKRGSMMQPCDWLRILRVSTSSLLPTSFLPPIFLPTFHPFS